MLWFFVAKRLQLFRRYNPCWTRDVATHIRDRNVVPSSVVYRQAEEGLRAFHASLFSRFLDAFLTPPGTACFMSPTRYLRTVSVASSLSKAETFDGLVGVEPQYSGRPAMQGELPGKVGRR